MHQVVWKRDNEILYVLHIYERSSMNGHMTRWRKRIVRLDGRMNGNHQHPYSSARLSQSRNVFPPTIETLARIVKEMASFSWRSFIFYFLQRTFTKKKTKTKLYREEGREGSSCLPFARWRAKPRGTYSETRLVCVGGGGGGGERKTGWEQDRLPNRAANTHWEKRGGWSLIQPTTAKRRRRRKSEKKRKK